MRELSSRPTRFIKTSKEREDIVESEEERTTMRVKGKQLKIKRLRDYFSQHTILIGKQIGDSILIVGTTFSMVSLENFPVWATYLSLIFTLVGKLVSNFFADSSD